MFKSMFRAPTPALVVDHRDAAGVLRNKYPLTLLQLMIKQDILIQLTWRTQHTDHTKFLINDDYKFIIAGRVSVMLWKGEHLIHNC